MRLQFGIYTAPGGNLLADWSGRVQKLIFSTNEHGFESISGDVPLALASALRYYDQPGTLHVEISDGAAHICEGRLEDPELWAEEQSGFHVGALGYWRALADLESAYTALFSTTRVDGWKALTSDDRADAFDKRFSFDTQNRLYIAPQHNATFGTTTVVKVGYLGFIPPDSGARQIAGVSFDFEIAAGTANWLFQLRSFTGSNWTTPTIQWNQAGAAGLQTGSLNLTFAGADRLAFMMYYNAADAIYGGETGGIYLKITNLRVVTALANRINTTLGTAIAAGTRTVTPASMARIYVGQRLNIGGAVSESVVVTAITSTTFTAVFAQAHLSTDTVQAFVVYADEIVSHLTTTTSALNSTQLSSVLTAIQSPALDLQNEIYEDANPADILNRLVGLGDNQVPPRQWEVGVADDRVLYFRPQATAGRIWYVDAASLRLQRSIDAVANSVYSTYQDASNRSVRTAANTDATSIARYDITRKTSIKSSTSDSTQAGVERDACLQDHRDPLPRAAITARAIYDATGRRGRLYDVRAGDTFIVRNVSPALSTELDRVSSFRLTRTTYDFDTQKLTVEPEAPLPRIDVLLAREAAGIT